MLPSPLGKVKGEKPDRSAYRQSFRLVRLPSSLYNAHGADQLPGLRRVDARSAEGKLP
jgi:hypothetical protein